VSGRRLAPLTLACLLWCGAPAHAAKAPELPALTVASRTAGHTTLSGATGLLAGPAHVRFTTTRSDATLALLALKPGTTADSLLAALRSAHGPRDVRDLASLLYAPEISARHDALAYLDLEAGTYAVADVSGKPAGPLKTFTVAARDPSAPPAPKMPHADAHLGMRDFRFVARPSIPRSGVLRYENTGATFHFADAIRLRSGASVTRALSALRAGRRTVPGAVSFSPLVGIVGPGESGAVDYRLHPGRYVLVCFFADGDSHDRPHTQLGMERAVRIR
jgi:hypothetical protein